MQPPKIIKLEPCLVAGFTATIGSYQDDNRAIISALWQELKGGLSPPLPDTRVAVMPPPSKDQLDGPVEYMAGVFIQAPEEAPKGSKTLAIPRGDYGEFIHIGAMRKISQTYHHIFKVWFPPSGRTLGAGPELGIYPMDADPDSETSEIKILIPLG